MINNGPQTLVPPPLVPLFRRRATHIAIAVVAVLVLGEALFVYAYFFRAEPAPYFESDEDHFLFGSVGTETETGVPYWVWLVLPRLFPELLPGPGGYASLGIVSKAGYEMPIGFSKVTVGFPRVGINCSMCHTASVRVSPEAIPAFIPGGPSHQLAAQQYLRFLTDAAADPRFTADTILTEISKNHRLSPVERILYRAFIIPGTRRNLLRLREESAWMQTRTAWGHGRVDRLNPVKFRALQQPIDATIGTVDMPALWNMQARRQSSYGYLWDGANGDLREVVFASAAADGATMAWLDGDHERWDNSDRQEMSSLQRVTNYISGVQPPRYPLAIDQPLAARGSQVFGGECASCHASGQPRFGQVVPVGEVGTDRHRLDMWTKPSAAAYNAYGEGHDWVFSKFKTTEGYVAVSLDGLWLRGPYLHNGSVPSLADLLEPADRRPKQFWRGHDVIDPVKVGFISEGTEAERVGTRFDTSRPGNGNAGHTYGTTLAPDLKRALLEYLKTL